MTFWFYITGFSGFIEFYVKDLATGEITEIWKSEIRNNFDFGKQWNFGSFGFYLNRPYIILIQGVSRDAQTVVALDDIIFKESEYCSVEPYLAAVGPGFPLPSKPITTTKTPSSTVNPPLYDCDFEYGYCNWRNDESRPMKWTRIRGSTNTQDTGPSFDHT